MAAVTPVVLPALWTAVSLDQIEEVRQLLADGADVEERGGEGETTPLSTAAAHGHEAVARLLLEHGADTVAESTAEYGTGRLGSMPLHYAALHSHVDILLLLLQNGADVSALDNIAYTPLHYAAVIGRKDVVWLLLEHGAEIDTLGADKRTPEVVATQASHLQVAQMIKAEPARREAVRRAQCVAFAMGQHARLGLQSRVRVLEAGVVQMVLEQV